MLRPAFPVIAVALCVAGSTGAQTTCTPSTLLDFECIPGVGLPVDQMSIGTQFQASHGISFSLEGGGLPKLAQVGPPRTAFQGPAGGDDNPAPGQNVGSFFLTDNDTLAPPVGIVIVDYSIPVSAASGVLLDIDGQEAWTIEARDAAGAVLCSVNLNTSSPNSGDGRATPWSFTCPGIHSLRFVYTGPFAGPGLAFDNFSPASVCVGPSASVPRNGTGSNPSGFVEVSPPIIGLAWDTSVDIVTPAAVASIVGVSLGGPTTGLMLNGVIQGELLCLPPYLPFDVSLTGAHSIQIPQDCTLIGQQFSTQAATFIVGNIALNNSIDLTIGTF